MALSSSYPKWKSSSLSLKLHFRVLENTHPVSQVENQESCQTLRSSHIQVLTTSKSCQSYLLEMCQNTCIPNSTGFIQAAYFFSRSPISFFTLPQRGFQQGQPYHATGCIISFNSSLIIEYKLWSLLQVSRNSTVFLSRYF